MADKKITQLDAVTTTANTDLLLVVRDPSTTPVNKKLEIGDLFGESAQTVFSKLDLRASGNATVAADTITLVSNNTMQFMTPFKVNSNRIMISTQSTPASSNNIAVGWETGRISYDSNYLYVAVSPSLIARFAANTSW